MVRSVLKVRIGTEVTTSSLTWMIGKIRICIVTMTAVKSGKYFAGLWNASGMQSGMLLDKFKLLK